MTSQAGGEDRVTPRVLRTEEASTDRLWAAEADARGRRLLVYIAFAVVLLVSAILVHRSEVQTGPYLHTLLEAVATVLAFVIGALALVRFYARQQISYLFLGTGFLGAGFLDLYHAVVTSPFAATSSDPDLSDLTAWTWTASRVFLSLFLVASWAAWRRERDRERADESARPVQERSVYLTAGFLTVVAFIFFARTPLVGAYYPELWVSRPGEVLPGLFFLLALVGYITKGEWRRDAFEHWLVVALIMSVATHLGFYIFSERQHDLASVVAHLLKVASYVAVLAGLMAGVYTTFWREKEASAAILDSNQALAHEVGVRRQAEQVLQESEDRLQDFLDHATDLIQSTDPLGRVLYVNDAWKRTLGYSDGEIVGRDILSFIHPDSKEGLRGVMRRVFQGESVSDFELTFRTRDGQAVICSGSSNCRFEDGRPVATRSIFRNVTEEHRAERELARSQANIRALFESTGDAIWSVDRQYRLLTFNTAFALTVEAMTGRAPRVNDGIEELASEGQMAWFERRFERALAGTRFSEITEAALAGQVRVYEFFFNPIESDAGPTGVVVFSKDITQRRAVEEELRRTKQEAEQANLAKSQFMANMSHELRTPLNSVIGFANILIKNRSGQLETKELGYLERIVANGKHLLSLINEILDLSKIEAGRMELELETLEIGHLVRETLAQMEGQVGAKPVRLRSEIQGDPVPILSDPGKLKQVLMNLVGNALKFTEQGEVVVRVEVEADSNSPKTIVVQDSGVGIPPDRLEAVFEAFQQADGSTTRQFGGTGLGLTISRSLCALMGYRIAVASEVGRGSTFTVHLTPGVEEHGHFE